VLHSIGDEERGEVRRGLALSGEARHGVYETKL
jgi:hypothetical protein